MTQDVVLLAVVFLAGGFGGFVTGFLMYRNNKQKMAKQEDLLRRVIVDRAVNAEQTVNKIRQIIGGV